MKSCQEMKELRSKSYEDLISYIERKMLSNIRNGYIYIDSDETLDKNVNFNDSGWINILEEKGYKVSYCSNFAISTVEISGW